MVLALESRLIFIFLLQLGASSIYDAFSNSRTIFLPSGNVESFSELLWIVAVNDFILKFVAVIFKIIIVMLPGNFLPYRKRVSNTNLPKRYS